MTLPRSIAAEMDARKRRSRALWILDDARILGGGQRFALRLADGALSTGLYERAVIACPADSALAEAAREAGLEVSDFSFPGPTLAGVMRLAEALRALRQSIASSDPITVIGNTARCQLAVTLALAGRRRRPRIVHLMHEQDSAARRVLRPMYRHAGRLEVVGANSARTYRQHLPGVVVHQINNFLTEAEFARLATVAPDAGRTPELRVLGVLGRMIPEKGLIELVGELARVGEDLWGELRIAALPAGEPYERRLRMSIAEHGLGERITLVGPAADAASFLATIDVLVVPSTGNEGQPTVILEALAAGLGVIVRRSTYSEDFDQLRVLPYTDPDELSEILASWPPSAPSTPDALLRERFGVAQALACLTLSRAESR